MPRPSSALSVIETTNGSVIIRSQFVKKLRQFALLFEGEQAAIKLLLPGWRPRSPTSRRAQLTSPVSVMTIADITAFWVEVEPRLREKLVAAQNGFVDSGTNETSSTRIVDQRAAARMLFDDYLHGPGVAITLINPISAQTMEEIFAAFLKLHPCFMHFLNDLRDQGAEWVEQGSP